MKVIVAEYNPQWQVMYEVEAKNIREILGEELITIYHIGSTSVPGLKAKPIIDIMPLVRDVGVVDGFNEEMIKLGYEPMGEFGIPGRRFFRKGVDHRTHHLHIFQLDSVDIERHLAFCGYLREYPEDAKQYGELKQSLAERFPDDIEAYVAGKDGFVKNLEQKAVKWYRENRF
ncbi:MAG: GrpB family protein [Bacillota bacterium]